LSRLVCIGIKVSEPGGFMTDLGMDTLDVAVQKINTLLNDMQKDLGWQGRKHQAYNLLRAVLHALRDRLPVEEAVKFGAQLPMIVRGFYYEGWKPSQVPVKMAKEEFMGRVRNEFIFDSDMSMEQLIKITLTHLFIHIDPNEAKHLQKVLPEDLQELLTLA
jgi:uncharacterized protein (DUF2267 family)